MKNFCLVFSICFLVGCGTGGDLGDLPTSPTSVAPVSPTVGVDVVYYTNENTRDPDHFHLAICPEGYSGQVRTQVCRHANTSNPQARTPGTIRWAGTLAPGRYYANVAIWGPDRSIDIAFTGGVARNSLQVKSSISAPVDVYRYRECGVTTTFTRRPDLWWGSAYLHEIEFWFVVGSPTTAC